MTEGRTLRSINLVAALADDRDEILGRVNLPRLLEDLAAPRGLYAKRNRFPCPNSAHVQTGKTPPVSITMLPAGYALWHCHGCGAGGTAVDALYEAGVASGFEEALQQLGGVRFAHLPRLDQRSRARMQGASTPASLSPADIEKARRHLTAYVEYCHGRLFSQAGHESLRWLYEERGLTDAEIIAHKIGHDPGYRKLKRAWRQLPAPAGPAVTLPLFDESGEVVYAQARPREVEADSSKFLNPYSEWIGTSPRLSAIKSLGRVDRRAVVVTEGLCDGIIAGRYYKTCASIGVDQPDDAVVKHLLKVASGRPLIVCFDADDAGRRGAQALVDRITSKGGFGAAITLPAKDVTQTLLETGKRFGATFRSLVDDARQRVQRERFRARSVGAALTRPDAFEIEM